MIKGQRVGAAIAVAALTTTLTAGVAVASNISHSDGHGKPEATVLGPTVTHTGKAPTGYTVTFRVNAPAATAMKIKGAWTFASEKSASTDPTNSQPISAANWKPGDFPLQSPNSPGETWAVATMSKDPKTGVWLYTVPLPSGVWDYQFYPNCTAAGASVAGCTAMTDPANLAFNTDGATTTGSPAVFSQVYVPSDRRFGTEDLSWQDEASRSKQGKVVDLPIPAPGTTSGVDNTVIYTPAGYDPKRSTPYPVFVLSHGGGENEIAWPTRGRLQQIVDNLIADHEMQPAVIVMPNGSTGTGFNYMAEITTNVLPYVESHYNVATTSSGRAFAGTSAFGTQANNFLFTNTSVFGYVGAWSPAGGAPAIASADGRAAPTGPAYTAPALKSVLGIHVVIGTQETGGNAPMMNAQTERIGLVNAPVPFTWFAADGGHTWTLWRDALKDFLTGTAFRTTTTAVSSTGTSLTASVAAASAAPARPSGTVQFLVGGVKLGNPVKLVNGKASYRYANAAGAAVTAVYGGDRYYNTSTGAAS